MDTLSLSKRATPMTPMTPRTPKASKKHYNKYELDNIPTQKFKVGYQKVTVDVDLEQNSIVGETEITILPLESSLKYVRLDCRGMQIKSIIVNQRRATYSYDDFLQNQEYMNNKENPVLSDYNYDPYFDSNSENISINQHSMLRTKFYPIFSDQNDPIDPSSSYNVCTSELIIKIPESIKLRLQNTSKISFSPVGTNRSLNETPNTANTLLNSDKVYTPLNIKISYNVKNMKNGVLFNGGKHTSIPKESWYCYTFNNDFGCSTSSWVPCIDNFHEKPAWDINIVIPKTIGDIGITKIIGTKEAEKALRKIALKQMDLNESRKDIDSSVKNINIGDDIDEDDEENNVESIPLVVAVPDLVSSRESPHPMDVAKKVVNFQFYNPVCAHHLGFAVGAFEKIPIVDLKRGTDELILNQNPINGDSSNDVSMSFNIDPANSNKVPTMLYYLPGKKQDVINSTIFLYKALDFYSKEFSSFPFTSYTLLFIDSLPSDICTFAGMTIASSKLLYNSKLIEPMIETTEKLSVALAEQYSGVNVLPKTLNDIWCTMGIARFMSNQFLKKLFGFNHYKFVFEKRCELLCELDVGKRPLANQLFRFPINADQDLEFIALKAPLVLSILDKRITKTDKLFGLSRVIPKIFLQAMSNDLINGNNLSTAHFQRVCEKVAHHKLESFFQNWIHNSGVPTFRITQKFNKKRLFIEMSIRQMQRSNLNKDDSDDILFENKEIVDVDRWKNFVDEANVHLIENDHFNAQVAFTGPVTVRIHEADGSPYEHILAISDALTKLDIQYNTKYRRRRREKREGTGDADDKEKDGEKETDSRRRDKDRDKGEENKINMLGDVLMTSEEIINWELKEEDPSNAEEDNSETSPLEEDKDEAFEWLRFDADNEWICKYTINLTDEKFESQLRQDRDVKAQYESVKHFANVLRPSLYHAKVLLRTLLDSRYYYGIREEAARGLAKISNEENDHIGMRFLLKTFKYLYCYENEIVKGYNEFDPKEYLPKPNDFSNFSNLFIMRAIIESLSKVKNKDGDSPIELKRILLHILKYYDNSDNKFDDTYFYSLILVALSNLIISSNREIVNLNADYATKNSEFSAPRDAKDEFVFDAIRELNRCLKMDKWSPSYNCNITKVVLEQKIRFVKAGLARLTFMDLLTYTLKDFHEDIRIVAYEGLLLLGGLRNANILNYYFTAMKLDESHFIRYQLNKNLLKCIGVAAYSGIPSLMDDEEFLQLLSVDQSDDKVSDKFGNRMIRIEDSSSAKLSMQSRKDEIARRSMKGSIDLLRRDLGIGKGLQHALWDTVHSCLIPINTRRNMFDVMMVLYEPKNSFIVKTDLPTDKRIIVKVKTKVLESANPTDLSFVVSLKREAKFKIQLPIFKLKVNEEKPKDKQKRGDIDKDLPASSQPPIKKPRKKRGANDFGNSLVQSHKTATKFEISIKLPTLKKQTASSIVKSEIIKHDPGAPLRFVRFNLLDKKVTISTDEDFGHIAVRDTCMVNLRINPETWKKYLEQKDEASKTESEGEVAVKVENKIDVSNIETVNNTNEEVPADVPSKIEAVDEEKNEKERIESVNENEKDSSVVSENIHLPEKESTNMPKKQSDPLHSESSKKTPNSPSTSISRSTSPPTATSLTENKNLNWGSNIVGKLNAMKRGSNTPSPPPSSAFGRSRSRSRSRSESPEKRNGKTTEKKKEGPKIKLRLK